MSTHPFAGRHVRLEEYHSLIRDGLLDEDDKLELLRGTIVAMTPQGIAHARVIRTLTEHLVLTLSGHARVLVQLPLTLGDDSEPEPDLAVVSLAEAARTDSHPRTALLIVEVAGDSLRKDRTLKCEIYACAGVSEYWIVNLEGRCVEVYRDPEPAAGRYATALCAGPAEVLVPVALPQARLSVEQLFA